MISSVRIEKVFFFCVRLLPLPPCEAPLKAWLAASYLECVYALYASKVVTGLSKFHVWRVNTRFR